MPPTSHSAKDEDDFMAGLLGDLDDSFSNVVPSLNPSPVKPAPASRPPITPQKQVPKILLKHTQLRTIVPSPSKVFSAGDVDISALLEGAEDWDWDDMNSDLPTPKKASPRKPNKTPQAPPYIPETCTRCIVESIAESEKGGYYQKILVVKLDRNEERRSVVLRDDWVATDVRIGDIVNILGEFTLVSPSSSSVTLSITITSKSNLLVLHPDLLLTATTLANAPECRRKPLLQNLVRTTSETTPSLVWGNMLHEVMQACFTASRWEKQWIDERIREVILRGLNELIKIDIGIEQAARELSARAQGLVEFSKRYLSDVPKPDAILTNTRAVYKESPALLAISQLLDIEEDILSPTYGLKGKLDATVYAVISDPVPGSSQRNLTGGPVPFEIKTGRTVAAMEHRAQTMLYTILTAERYGVQVPAGLLYYTQTTEVVRVPATRNELRGLFTSRNEMAAYMMRRNRKVHLSQTDMEDGCTREPFLPPIIDNERTCKRCFALDACMLYRKAVENVIDTTSSIADIYEMKTGHLTPAHTTFFKQWEALVSLEEQDLIRFRKELWTMGAAERETKGRCFGSMLLDISFHRQAPQVPVSGDSKIHRFTYRFIRADTAGFLPSLLNGSMNSGDPVTVSVEPNLLALARGFIVELTPDAVVIGVDHEVNPQTIRTRLRGLQRGQTPSIPSQVIFRIDKDELLSGMGRIRNNLAQLFYADGDKRRLELVVDLRTPVFKDDALSVSSSIKKYGAHLNPNQRLAMEKVITAQDYALILGMPGMGKTVVIATIIKALVAMGKTILLTSYTHSAVDTILSKLTDADFGILRLGNLDKIHPDVHKLTLANRRTAMTIEQLQHQLMTPPVVATTCLSIDQCVKNKAAREGGLDVSLFRRLSDAHPHAVVDLTHQYRMNEDIMVLSNKLIYGDRLRCGSEKVAHQSLELPDRTFLDSLHESIASCHPDGCWLEKLMAER
ncbi:DNA replication factor Dna2-domain-containing protein [Collybia nuda]|uniref:DNA helicase n=1 Tax=Collybia nuda TaxID=64659 RepID=A0A9P6CDW2_9AGAR|nr:DNA replication factor Dna2-domain-containing protein [Collybia nuda]